MGAAALSTMRSRDQRVGSEAPDSERIVGHTELIRWWLARSRLVFSYEAMWAAAGSNRKSCNEEESQARGPEVGFGVIATSQPSSSPRLSFTAWPSFCLQPRYR